MRIGVFFFFFLKAINNELKKLMWEFSFLIANVIL